MGIQLAKPAGLNRQQLHWRSRIVSQEAEELEKLPGSAEGNFSQLLADLEISENKLQQANPQIHKKP
ncbi:MAG: hypothetical protein GY696_14515 [Gammaproteobacteria bacterium]|nr:hypothetical protein [Gammaproteobacteria bacterium]